MYYFFKYLKHLLAATNQHGVHSPFVYDYLTKCLYTKPKFRDSKSESVLLKSIPYFEIEKFKISSSDSRIENRIQKEFDLEVSIETPFDLIYLDYPEENILNIYKDRIHNDSMMLLENIHRNKDATKTWETLKQNLQVTVSIDMFHCGALFFRKEQEKEHFKIRI
ncbi:MAG: hypothetical protein AB8B59_05835 [Maribacter sp.]